jgi:hypothetical protein
MAVEIAELQVISKLSEVEARLARLEAAPQRRLITDYAWHRGFKDDFFGLAFDDRYELRTEAAARSTLALMDGMHGGVARLLTGNVASDYARIMLGDATYATDDLDPDGGFWVIGYWKLSSTANILGDMFVCDINWNRIHVTADTTQGVDWYLRTDNNSGVDNWVDSGVAFDTAWHWHGLRVMPGKAEHWLDGELINGTTVKIPTVAMTASIRCLTRGAATRYMYLNFWGIIPE